MTINNKSKDELIEIIEDLTNDKENLKNDVEYWIKEHSNLEEQIEDLTNQIDELEIFNGIKDINNFLWRLKIDDYNLFKKIKPFIDNYLRFYNN